MSQLRIESETHQVARQLPPGPRLAVLGSSSFWGSDTDEICGAVGAQLAEIEGLVLLTGGVPGVGEAVGRAFWDARLESADGSYVFHILPRGSEIWDYGTTLFSGTTMLDRREVLGRIARVYLAIEGGPGTAHEVRIVQSEGGYVVPIGRTGGHSEELFCQLDCPTPRLAMNWQKLSDRTASVGQVAGAVQTIVEKLLRDGG